MSDFDFGFNDAPVAPRSDEELAADIAHMRTHNYMATLDGAIEDAEAELANRAKWGNSYGPVQDCTVCKGAGNIPANFPYTAGGSCWQCNGTGKTHTITVACVYCDGGIVEDWDHETQTGSGVTSGCGACRLTPGKSTYEAAFA